MFLGWIACHALGRIREEFILIKALLFIFVLAVTAAAQCPTPSPTPSPSPTPTPTPSPSPSPASTPACLSGVGPLVTLSGDFTSPYSNNSLAANTRIDARLARWIHAGSKPYRIGGGANVCAVGGEITGNYPLSTSWDVMHGTYAFEIRGPNYTAENWRIHNYGDGFAIWDNGNNFLIKGSYLFQIRDDAFSNDPGWAGIVDDVLVDGTYVGFSDKGNAIATSSAVWFIKNTLVRLQVYEQTYQNGPPGHGWFWKFDSNAVKIDLHGNIFMTEEASIHGSHKFLPEKVVSCKKADGSPDNIIVWLGSGPYPRPGEIGSGCFSLVTDRAVWDTAVADWKLRHGY